MSNNRHENIWQMLRDFNFIINNEISNKVICVICNKILINGCNGPCGCRYCLDCITNYLDGSMKYCPANMDDCKIELLNIDTNIHIDNHINNKISKLIVKCPQMSCNYKDELRKMEDHLRVCYSRAVNCPYCNIGCKFDKIANDKLEEHLLLDNQVHVKLLMECIDVMRNEMDSLNKEMKANEERNKLADLQLHNKIEQQTTEINQDIVALRNVDRCHQNELKIVQTRERQRETHVKLDQLNENIGALIRDNSDMKQQINNMKIQTEENKMDNLQIKKQTSEQDAQINQLKQDNKSIIDKFGKIERDSEKKQNEFSTIIDTTSHENTNTIAKLEQINPSIKTIERKVTNLQINNLAKQISNNKFAYLWTINKISDKIKQWKNDIKLTMKQQINNMKIQNDIKIIYGDNFYSYGNGYNLCLCLTIGRFIIGDDFYIDVGFCICRGEFDDILSWPFKHIVTVSLINQQDNSIYSSKTIQYDNKSDINNYNKPTTNRNEPIYQSYPNYLTTFNQLLSNKSLSKNHQIIIKCVVEIIC